MFCTLCWNEYLNTKILEENIGQHIFCPATNCSILVDENFVRFVSIFIFLRMHKLFFNISPSFTSALNSLRQNYHYYQFHHISSTTMIEQQVVSFV